MVLRSGNNSSANSGLAYANANNACSNSNTNYGARLNLLRLNRVTLQGNEIVKVFREGFEPLATATHCAGKPKNDNNLRMWSVAPATSTGPEGSNIETMDAETAHNIKYDLIPQECSNLPAALRHAGFPIDNILDEIVSDANLSDGFDYVISHLETAQQREKYYSKQDPAKVHITSTR